GPITPSHSGGSFETVGGLQVFNTGGTKSGEQHEIPWWTGNYWDEYTNIGYVDLGAATGDLLCTLESFTIETYFRLPENAQSDRVGQQIWFFADQISPDNSVWMNTREYQFVTHITAQEPVDETVAATWEEADAVRSNGTWHHLVVSKGGGTATVYQDGEVVASGASTRLTTDFAAGTFTVNQLGAPCYPAGVYDQGLFDTDFYNFAIYDEALNAAQVKDLYQNGPIAKLRSE
ncbi:MAG: LamG domain-containing protein, partial [Spirochaetaceae bacterium]|nr:LamG domain-containing protein [Spirochaetaceae bacterium]